MSNIEFLEVAGVPVVVCPPANPSLPAPLIVLWYGFGVPNSEEMLAETLPLDEVQVWASNASACDLEAAKNLPEMQQDMTELQQVIATTWFSQHLI